MLEHRFPGLLTLESRGRPGIGSKENPIEHVGVEDASLWHGSKREGHDDLFPAGGGVAGEAKQVVKVGSANVYVGEDRVDGVGVIVISGDQSTWVRQRNADRKGKKKGGAGCT